jgi:mannose-6-phosphate isomerase-like protein (cupin superfamily)
MDETIKRVEKLWGHEEWIVNVPEYCGKVLVLRYGFVSSYHFHKKKKETFYVWQGKVKMIIDGLVKVMTAGDAVTIERRQEHCFQAYNLGGAVVIEFSQKHDEADVYRVTESKRILP